MWWTTGSGVIELEITLKQARACSHPGPCDADVAELRKVPKIRRQLNKINPDTLRKELSEYGAWDDKDLADHSDNLDRILWIACCDLDEQNVGGRA